MDTPKEGEGKVKMRGHVQEPTRVQWRYASRYPHAELVRVVEPEVLKDGKDSLARCTVRTRS